MVFNVTPLYRYLGLPIPESFSLTAIYAERLKVVWSLSQVALVQCRALGLIPISPQVFMTTAFPAFSYGAAVWFAYDKDSKAVHRFNVPQLFFLRCCLGVPKGFRNFAVW